MCAWLRVTELFAVRGGGDSKGGVCRCVVVRVLLMSLLWCGQRGCVPLGEGPPLVLGERKLRH